jgi:hypothetical protein
MASSADVKGLEPNKSPKAPSNGSLVDKGKDITSKSQGMPAVTGAGKRARQNKSGAQGHN